MPNKLLGQNFLKDKTIAARMAAAADLSPSDTVIEVGPGKGVLTEKLLASGALVLAVEKDRQLFLLLREKFKDCPNLCLKEGDILKMLPALTAGLANFHVVANIPYYLTSRLIRLLLENKPQPQQIILMVQKEVAQRIVAAPPRGNLLGMSVQFYGQPSILLSVPKEKFQPQPKIDSAVIEINPQNPLFSDEQLFFKILKAGFASRRKTLFNNFVNILKLGKIETEQWLIRCDLNKLNRAQELNLEQWACLAKNSPNF